MRTTVRALLDRYPVVVLDAYGVLNDARGALPGAPELIDELRARGQRFFVATNDASRLPETAAARFARFGLAIEAGAIITSGSLLAPYFAARGLAGARCFVLGTDDSERYVQLAGGEVAPPRADGDYDAFVVADDAGYPFLETVDAALSALYRALDAGRAPALVLPNPDLVYPKSRDSYGFTSGAVAAMLELGLRRRYGDDAPAFEPLGKPHPPMFAEAERRAGTRDFVMIGDQLETDIAGAIGYGVDAALLLTGVSRAGGNVEPTWILDSLVTPGSSTP